MITAKPEFEQVKSVVVKKTSPWKSFDNVAVRKKMLGKRNF